MSYDTTLDVCKWVYISDAVCLGIGGNFIYAYRTMNNLTDDLNRYSLQVVPRHDDSPPLNHDDASRDTRRPPRQATAAQRAVYASSSQGSQFTKDLQRQRSMPRAMAASGGVSTKPAEDDLGQQRGQAQMVVAPHHQQPPANPPDFIIPSFLSSPIRSTSLLPQYSPPADTLTTSTSAIDDSLQSRDLDPFRSLLLPKFGAADAPTTGPATIDKSLESRQLVPLNYFKDNGLGPLESSLKDDTLLPDHKDRLQEDDTAATSSGASNPMVASDLVAPEESTSGDQRQSLRRSRAGSSHISTTDYNDSVRESFPDDASEELDTWREQFILEFITLPYGPSEEEIRRRIHFFQDHSGMTQDEIDEARKPYERVCYRQSPRSNEPFLIDGRIETYELDRIKCWVNFNRHLTRRHPAWPEHYQPICTEGELLNALVYAQDDDAVSMYTTQSVTASSLG